MEYNSYVEQAQMDLVVAGYSVGKSGIDGKFGKDTLQAVNDVIADAIACTGGEIDPTEPETEYPFNGELEHGDVGEDVKNLQRLLDKWHMRYYLGDSYIDGVFGAGTKEAVIEFQKGMTQEIDGKVDKKLWALLNSKPVDISFWTTIHISENEEDDGRLPFECNCNGKYCDSAKNAIPGKTSVGLMILLVRIEKEMNLRFRRDDIKLHLTDDMNTQDHDDRNGGNRCETWNEHCGGSQNSQHTKWRAADVYFECEFTEDCPEMPDLYTVADELNPYGGVGEYDRNIHVDTRGSRARW